MGKVTGLGHVGIYVQDIDMMTDFYTNVLGFTITDGGGEGARGVFLSAHPESEHHEVVLAQNAEQKTNAQQISLTVGSLKDLKELYADIKAYPGTEIWQVLNHGIAFGCYFNDPEGNRIEVYWSTGLDYPQPCADPIDLDAPEDELLALLDALPAREALRPHYYGTDTGKRLAAAN